MHIVRDQQWADTPKRKYDYKNCDDDSDHEWLLMYAPEYRMTAHFMAQPPG